MGSGSWSPDEYKDHVARSNYDKKSTHEIFSSRHLHPDLDPQGVMRESRDSVDKAASNAIIVALDVTGSMSSVIDVMARRGLNTLFTEVYSRNPVTDPHLMFMGIGDVAAGDRAPLQVSQFEADIRIAGQLEKLWLEGGGGGNNYESYALAWWFAAKQTSIDCFEKRGKRGYLFTIGDEEPTPRLLASEIHRVTGERPAQDLSSADLILMASKKWNIFHIIVEEGNHMISNRDETVGKWRDLLGQRAVLLSDHTKLAEMIVSIIQICEGARPDDVANSWNDKTARVVHDATKQLAAAPGHHGSGVVRL